MPIELRHVTLVYGEGTPFEVKALDDINLKIENGEFVGIIGHTGSGKSTLIQQMNALMKPTSGTVLVDGEDINASESKVALRRRVGLVFQYPEYQLFEETVLKDVCYGPGNMGLAEDEVLARAKKALNMVGLQEENWGRSPFELSGGQKRRAAIAGVLAMQPEVLILDEPAAGLDPAGRREIMGIISGIHASGTTVIMVSHSMDDVARLCKRIVVLKNGQIALDGTPEQVFSDETRIKDLELSLPQAALLRNRLVQKGMDLPENVYTVEALARAIASKR